MRSKSYTKAICFNINLSIFFLGSNKFEFKEGETIVLTCYLPDKTKKNVLFCIDYIVKHSMELNDWQGKQKFKLMNSSHFFFKFR